MAKVKLLKVDALTGDYTEHSATADSLEVSSLFLGAAELTEAKLANLVDGADAADEHIHDSRYFRENEHIDASAGAADAGKPIKLDAAGHLDASMINDADVSHDDTDGVANSEAHIKFPLLAGGRDFTAVQQYDSAKTFSSPLDLVSRDYVDSQFAGAGTAAEWQDSAKSVELDDTAIVAPSAGDRFLILGTGINGFTGQDNKIAEYNGATYDYTTPVTGTYVSVDDENDGIYYFGGVSWTKKLWEGTTASLGVKKIGLDIQLDLVASEGLELVGNSARVKVADLMGEGLKDDGSNNFAVDFSTTFADHKAVAADDLKASIIPVLDAGGNFTGTEVEAVLAELKGYINTEITDRQNGDSANANALELLANTPQQQIFHVAKNGNDSTGTGSEANPYLTVAGAQADITDATSTKRYVIVINPGAYLELAGFELLNHVTYLGMGSRGSTSLSVATGVIAWNVPDVASPKVNLHNISIFSPITITVNNAVNIAVLEAYHLFTTGTITINNTGAAQPQYQMKYSRLGSIVTTGNTFGTIEFCTHNSITHGSASATTNEGSLFRRGSMTTGVGNTVTVNAGSYYAYNSYADTTVINDRGVAGAKDLIYTADSIRNNALTVTGTFSTLRLSDIRHTAYVPAVSGNWDVAPTEGKAALDELASRVKLGEADILELFQLVDEAGGVEYTAAAGGVNKGALLSQSANDTVAPLDITTGVSAVGLAFTAAAAAAEVTTVNTDFVVPGVLTGATFGTKYYWTGSAYSTSMPSGAAEYVWQVGYAKNATDLVVSVKFIKRNAV